MSSTNAPAHTEYLVPARDVSEFSHEVEGSGEWMKKRDLVGKGPFNILAGNERDAEYQTKKFREVVFTVQFLTGDIAGCQVNTSMEADDARRRVLTAVGKHGPHGPYWMERVEREGKNPYYRLTTKDPMQTEVLADDADERLPFDEPAPKAAAAAATRRRSDRR
jgi:hypothetical protein